MTFGEFLRACRMEAGLGPLALARAAGIEKMRTYVYRLERDECEPGLDLADRLLVACGSSLADYLAQREIVQKS